MPDQERAPTANGELENQPSLDPDIFPDDTVDGRPAIPTPPPVDSGGDVPKLRRVWFRDFKGFSDTTIELAAFNVIVGVNNAGKSTVLQGLDLLFSLMAIHSDHGGLSTAGRLIAPEILPVSEVRDLFYMRRNRRSNKYVNATVGAAFTDGSRVEFGIRHLFGGANSKVTEDIGMSGERLKAVLGKPAIWVPSSVGIVREEEFRTPARKAALIAGGRHNEILRNQLRDLRASRPERFEQLQEIVLGRFHASLDGVEFNELVDQYVRTEYLGEDGRRHDLYSSGSGFVQVVQLLAFILARDTSVVLIDEPDAHLHSSMQRTVIDILEQLATEQGIQVLLATHSKEIINFVDPSRLILVDPSESLTGPVSAEITPMTILKELGNIDNIDAVSLLKSKKCLFVEGDSDVLVADRFVSKLGLAPFSGDDRVVVMQVGGADRFGHVEQLDVLEALLGSPITSLEIRDRDGRIAEHRLAVIDGSQRSLHLLEYDCMESYLVEPKVIARVIASLLEERNIDATPPSVSDIADLIEAACDDLRDTTIDHVSQRFMDEKWKLCGERVGVAEANEKARGVVEAAWANLNERLAFVPGKQLLASVRRSIQDQYGVNFGNERLAEGFTADEIPTELEGLLRKVDAF